MKKFICFCIIAVICVSCIGAISACSPSGSIVDTWYILRIVNYDEVSSDVYVFYSNGTAEWYRVSQNVESVGFKKSDFDPRETYTYKKISDSQYAMYRADNGNSLGSIYYDSETDSLSGSSIGYGNGEKYYRLSSFEPSDIYDISNGAIWYITDYYGYSDLLIFDLYGKVDYYRIHQNVEEVGFYYDFTPNETYEYSCYADGIYELFLDGKHLCYVFYDDRTDTVIKGRTEYSRLSLP